MKRFILFAAAAAVMLAAGIIIQSSGSTVDAATFDFEVWVTDQGTDQVHVLSPRGNHLDLEATIDYAQASAQLGVPLADPHMVLFGLHGQPGSRYGYVGNVGSGNSTVIDAATRQIVAVIPTGTRTHAVQPSPDGTRALALVLGPAPCATAPDCGQVAEIVTDTANGVFTLGRTFRYSDFAAHPEAGLLPNFNPVCGSFTADGNFFYVTLSGGGLVIFAVNHNPAEPLFDVVDILGAGTGPGEIAENGCGIGYSVDGSRMFANSGTGTHSFYYVFDTATHTLIHSQDVSSLVTDIHGMMLNPNGRDVVMAGRLSDNFIVIDQQTGELRANRTFGSGPADTPDLTDFAPNGQWLYVTLRGPNPATGTHTVSGQTPGVAVIQFSARKVQRVVELPGDPQQQDPHGIAVRRLN